MRVLLLTNLYTFIEEEYTHSTVRMKKRLRKKYTGPVILCLFFPYSIYPVFLTIYKTSWNGPKNSPKIHSTFIEYINQNSSIDMWEK